MTRNSILSNIQTNGLRALRWACDETVANPTRPRDDAGFDCQIGSRLMAAALRSLPEDAPADLCAYFDLQRDEENGHCRAGGGHGANEEMARRIADFHLGVLKELGWTGLVTTMCLTGERMAMGTAIGELMVRRADPSYEPGSVHGRAPKYFSEEFNHTTTPLLLLAAHATDAQLEKALAAQERFLTLLHVTNGEAKEIPAV